MLKKGSMAEFFVAGLPSLFSTAVASHTYTFTTLLVACLKTTGSIGAVKALK
jgi:hypothetical protein